MSIRKPKENLWFHVFDLIIGFFLSIGNTIELIYTTIFKKTLSKKITPNHFLSSLHFLIHQFPKSFWKKPTGIGMGRSIGTLLLYFFGKNIFFNETKETNIRIHKERGTSKQGFTLIETMISITLFSGILLAAFSAFGNIAHLKNKIVSDVDVYEQLYVAVENLSSIIKDGGDIDYEEYFNRSLVGTSLSGDHYSVSSGFGNYGQGGNIGTTTFGDDVYYCRSSSSTAIVDGNGCALTGAINTTGTNQSGKLQRYGEYKLQFTDYNSRGNNDTALCNAKGKSGMALGDQDCDGKIIGDADDENLGLGPSVFTKNTALPELYLINKSTSNPTRLLLRLKIEQDPDAPSVAPCNVAAGTGSGCIGRLQMLKLIGRDLGLKHGNPSSSSTYDGKIDTWECVSGFDCTGPSTLIGKLPTGNDSEWVDVFSKDISVNSAQFFLNPNIDYSLAWKDSADSLANSYLRMSLRLGYSWKKRKLIQGGAPEVNITTTISLRK